MSPFGKDMNDNQTYGIPTVITTRDMPRLPLQPGEFLPAKPQPVLEIIDQVFALLDEDDFSLDNSSSEPSTSQEEESDEHHQDIKDPFQQ